MDYEKISATIKLLRLQKKMTQKQLAAQLNITEQAISKWERGIGMPDISMYSSLAELLGVNVEVILTGNIEENTEVKNNMKNMKYYICPECNNFIMSSAEAGISCCGRPMEPCEIKKATDEEKMIVEEIDGERYITCNHPMTKDDYISFTVFASNELLEIVRHYPEWSMERRLPKSYHGIFIWYSEKAGMKYQLI